MSGSDFSLSVSGIRDSFASGAVPTDPCPPVPVVNRKLLFGSAFVNARLHFPNGDPAFCPHKVAFYPLEYSLRERPARILRMNSGYDWIDTKDPHTRQIYPVQECNVYVYNPLFLHGTFLYGTFLYGILARYFFV